jgi:hypothetical protein
VNRRHGERDALLARFAAEGIDARAEGDAGIVVAVPRPVATLPGFAEGAFSVLDLMRGAYAHAIDEFAGRQRRFGRTGEQVTAVDHRGG